MQGGEYVRRVVRASLAVSLVLFLYLGVSISQSAAETLESFHIVGAEGQPKYEHGWSANSFSGYQKPGFYKDPYCLIHLVGIAIAGENGKSIFILPEGFRPSENEVFAGDAGGSFAELKVNSNGEVITGGSSSDVRISGVTFRAFGTCTLPSSEGKEGKEGPTGPTGPAGAEGPEGKAGASAPPTESKLTSFGTEAQVTLSELKESMELIGWCVIGTMLGLSLAFFLYKLLIPGRVESQK